MAILGESKAVEFNTRCLVDLLNMRSTINFQLYQSCESRKLIKYCGNCNVDERGHSKRMRKTFLLAMVGMQCL